MAAFALAALAVPTESFAQSLSFPGPTSYQSWAGTNLASADLNGDGRVDIVSVKYPSANLFVAYNNGNGTFAENILFGGGGVSKAIIADVNGDGRPDIVTVGNGPWGWGLTIYLNNGSGGFSATFAYPTSNFSYWYGTEFNRSQPISVEAGKTTSNGNVDLVVSDIKGFPLQVFRGVGNGSFLPGPKIPNPTGGTYGSRALKLVDLNGDGALDLVATGGYYSYFVRVWHNDGMGNFTSMFTAPVPAGTQGTTPLDLKIIDMNLDGRPDLVVSTVAFDQPGGPGTIYYYRNTGNLANFVPHTAFSGQGQQTDGNGNWYPAAYGIMAAADLDHDGNVDLVATPVNGRPALLRNNGNGTFSEVWLAPSSSPTIPYGFVETVYLVDIAGNGKPTLLGGKGQSGGNRGIVYGSVQVTQPLPTQTLTILGGSGNVGDVAANVEYSPSAGNWQPAYLAQFYNEWGQPISMHPWGNILDTNQWINYRVDGKSDAGASVSNTLWYLYRVRFTVPADAVEAKMTFSLKADNRAQVAINGFSTGAEIVGQANGVNADAVFAQKVLPGENTITLKVGDEGGLNGFNFRIDLSVKSAQPLVIVPTNRPPVAFAGPDQTVEATSASGATVTLNGTGSADPDNNISSYRWHEGPTTLGTAATIVTGLGLGDHTVTLAVIDSGNLSNSDSISVNVLDRTAPALTVPSMAPVEATGANGAAVSFAATATDAVTASPSITYSVGATPTSSPSTFPVGATTVTAKATDAAGNASTGKFTINVQDTTAPVITSVPANQVIEATSAAGAVTTFGGTTATDAVGPVTFTYSPASGSTFAIGTTPVTVTAKDAYNNTSTSSFSIKVEDTTAPVITSVPANQLIEATSAAGAVATFGGATATDAVGPVTFTYSPASGSTFAIGTTTVTVTSKDAYNNTSTTSSFSIKVQDTTAPVITSVPANQVIEATSAAGAVATFGGATATDAVGPVTLTYSIASGSTFALGDTTVTVTAKDGYNNVSAASFTITVQDTTAPVFTSLTASSATLWPANHKMVAVSLRADATDNVGVETLKIFSVISSEPDNGLGDGDTAGDIQVTGALTLNLRAERSGNGNGRTYTITVRAMDAKGHATDKIVKVFVPKSQSGK